MKDGELIGKVHNSVYQQFKKRIRRTSGYWQCCRKSSEPVDNILLKHRELYE